MLALPRFSARNGSRLLAILLIASTPFLSGCFGVKIKKLRADKQMLEAQVMQLQQDLTACQESTLNAEKKAKTSDAQVKELDDLRSQLKRTKDDLAATKLAMSQASNSGAKEFAGRLSQSLETEQALKEKIERLETEVSTKDVNETKLEQQITDLKDKMAAEQRAAADGRLKTETLQKDLDSLTKKLADRESETAKVTESETKLRADLKAAQDQLATLTTDLASTKQQLAAKETELQAKVAELAAKGDLDKQLAAAKADSEKAVKDAEERVKATLPKRVSADAIGAAETSAAGKLSAAVVAGNAKVSRSDDGIVIALTSDAVFKPGTTLLSDTGLLMLKDAAEAIKAQPVRLVEIAGHTDDVPVKNMPYPDNWELAAARATEVTRWLAGQPGIEAASLVAQSHAYFQPLDAAKTAAARKTNRRVEIVVHLVAR